MTCPLEMKTIDIAVGSTTNATLRDLLAQRSREPGVYTLDQVRQELALRDGSE